MRRLVATIVCALVALTVALLTHADGGFAQSEGTLKNRIESGKAQAGALGDQISRLKALEAKILSDVSVLQGRVDEVQAELEVAQAKARRTAAALAAERERAARLQKRLGQVRAKLAALLRERYVSPEPDLLTVVVNADGFEDLLEQVEFVRRVQTYDTRLLDLVRSARADAVAERARLDELSDKRDAEAEAVAARRAALSGMLEGLRSRQAALATARAARQAALTRTKAGTARAQKALDKLEADRAAAARATSFPTSSSGGPTPVGPGSNGPWAIPAAIVMCESGGQNLTPNSAGASGYYQFMPATWRGLGGSTPHAYQASKAEQDKLAARLWAGGAGASNWVCASLVG